MGGRTLIAGGVLAGIAIVAVPAGLAIRSQKSATVFPSVTQQPGQLSDNHTSETPVPRQPSQDIAPKPVGSSKPQADAAQEPSARRDHEDRPRKAPGPGESTGNTLREADDTHNTQPSQDSTASVTELDHPPGLPKPAELPPDESTMTPLTGRHMGGLILRRDKSPYLLTGRSEILGQLEIEPGVAVWLLPDRYPNAKLIVQGPVSAQGTPNQPILLAAPSTGGTPLPPVILESPSVGKTGDQEGWQMRYVGVAGCSLVATMRAGQNDLRFCRLSGEFRLETDRGTVSITDCWFESGHDLILTGQNVVIERTIVSPAEASTAKKFMIATAGTLRAVDCSLHAEFLRLQNRNGSAPSLFLQRNTFSSRQMTLQIAQTSKLRVVQNNFYLYYRLQVLGVPSDHPSGANLSQNFWEIEARDESWPYQPPITDQERIVTVQDLPKLDKSISRYVWRLAQPPKLQGSTP